MHAPGWQIYYEVGLANCRKVITVSADKGRLARAVLQIYHHDPAMPPQARAKLSEVIHAGRCIEYAERLRAHHDRRVSQALAEQYAVALGFGIIDLRISVLPLLKQAGVVDYQFESGQVAYVEEYVGLSAPFLAQVVSVLEACSPTEVQWTALGSVQLATLAPLARRDHLERLSRDSTDEMAKAGLQLALAAKVLRRVRSSVLPADGVTADFYRGPDHIVFLCGIEMIHERYAS